MRLLAFLLIATILAAGPGRAASEREALINTFALIGPSVGALYAQHEDGDMTFLCSATAVDRRGGETVVLTAYHCLRQGVAYLIDFGDRQMHSVSVWKIPHYEVDADAYPRKYNEPETDMALLLMEGTDVPVMPLATSSRFQPGTKIATVGYPLGISRTSYEGIVAGRYDRPGSDNYDYLLLQIFGAPGSSGSAVVAADTGEVIGVLVASTKGRNFGLPVMYATPIEYMRHLMEVRPAQQPGTSETGTGQQGECVHCAIPKPGEADRQG